VSAMRVFQHLSPRLPQRAFVSGSRRHLITGPKQVKPELYTTVFLSSAVGAAVGGFYGRIKPPPPEHDAVFGMILGITVGAPVGGCLGLSLPIFAPIMAMGVSMYAIGAGYNRWVQK